MDLIWAYLIHAAASCEQLDDATLRRFVKDGWDYSRASVGFSIGLLIPAADRHDSESGAEDEDEIRVPPERSTERGKERLRDISGKLNEIERMACKLLPVKKRQTVDRRFFGSKQRKTRNYDSEDSSDNA